MEAHNSNPGCWILLHQSCASTHNQLDSVTTLGYIVGDTTARNQSANCQPVENFPLKRPTWLLTKIFYNDNNKNETTMSTFEERLKAVMGERGYEHCMRRSVQTIILIEANRMVKDRLLALRPFQRKLAFFDQAKALVQEIECIPAEYRPEILWRTASSKEQMEPDTAWKRLKMIEKDIEKMAEKIKPLCADEKSHDEVCEEYVQQLFEQVSGGQGLRPPDWEHSHNNLVMAYRMYYRGAELDPTFPPPGEPKEIVVPASKPKVAVSVDGISESKPKKPEEVFLESPDRRRAIIAEVADYLALLKNFEGAIPVTVLDKRKRELFEALPSAPPSLSERAKQQRKD